MPAPSTPRLNEFEISQYTSSTPNTSAMKNEREALRSREFSMLFLNGETDTGLDIPYKELVIKRKIGSGGFKDCYEGNKHYVRKNNNFFYKQIAKFRCLQRSNNIAVYR